MRIPVPFSSTDWLCADEIEKFPSATHDFIWNADYTQFRAVPLRWWDDASYIDYQAADPFAGDPE